jgi:hypothetical protein
LRDATAPAEEKTQRLLELGVGEGALKAAKARAAGIIRVFEYFVARERENLVRMKREIACLGHVASLAVENSGTFREGNVCESKVGRKRRGVNKIYTSIYYTEQFILAAVSLR